jgi:hypothetical protein
MGVIATHACTLSIIIANELSFPAIVLINTNKLFLKIVEFIKLTLLRSLLSFENERRGKLDTQLAPPRMDRPRTQTPLIMEV